MTHQHTFDWPDELLVLVDQMENEADERSLTREERAVLDVYETVPVLESDDCLHEFWQSGTDQQRIIKSFDLIGATVLVDCFNASSWCRTRGEDRNDFSEAEAEHLAGIEEELAEGMEDLVDLLMEFIEDEGLNDG